MRPTFLVLFALLGLPNQTLGRTAALVPKPFLMPGLFEVTVEPLASKTASPATQMAVTYGHYLAGPYRGTATVELRRNGVVLGREAPRRIDLAEKQTLRLGQGRLLDGHFGGPQPDFVVPSEAGAYSLTVVLTGQTLEERFQVAQVKTVVGSAPGVPAAEYLSRAALRMSPPYYNEKTRPGEIFWMTIPTDLRQERTRLDFLFYQDGVLAGSFLRDLPLPPIRNTPASRLKVPLHVGGWMDNLAKEAVLEHDGHWEVHVIQDAAYLTTCKFIVDFGHFSGRGAGSRSLRCAADNSASAKEASKVGQRFKGYKQVPKRVQAIQALLRSAQPESDD